MTLCAPWYRWAQPSPPPPPCAAGTAPRGALLCFLTALPCVPPRLPPLQHTHAPPPPPPPQGLNPFGARSSQYRFWEEAELRELCDAVGLADWQRSRSRSFIMFAARKPQ